jgi:hypothetical protein
VRLLVQFISFCFVILYVLPVWAHGVVGKRFFIEPIGTEAATINPDYGVDLSRIKGTEGTEREVGTGFAFRLTENLGMEIEGEWVSLEATGMEKEHGLANPELTLKYVAYQNGQQESIGTFALKIEPPWGSKKMRGGEEVEWGIGFLYGKGLGAVPEKLTYLRPLMVQGDMFLHAESYGLDLALYYSFPYLQQFVRDVGMPWPINRLFPMIDFHYEQDQAISESTGILRPGVIFVGRRVQVGLATIVPIFGAARTADEKGAVGTVTFHLDDIFPGKRTPLF